MTETIDVISGLLTQKPESPAPEEGQLKCFTVEKRTSAKGKDWWKVKNSSPDKGGQNYRIISVKQTDFTDAHGNVSYSVELEKAGQPTQSPTNAATGPHSASTGHPETLSRDDYWARKEARDIAQQPRIERQSARRDAIEFYKLERQLTPPDKQHAALERVKELMGIFESWLNEEKSIPF